MFHFRLRSKAPAQQKPRTPVLRSLNIGINYTGKPYDLLGCIKDALNMKTFLTGKGYNCVAMTDYTAVKPTKANILRALTQMLTLAQPGDKCFFTYSGHGTNTRDRSGDEVDGKDEAIFTLDAQLLTDDEFRAVLNQSLKAGVELIALFDSCYSGTVLDLRYTYSPNSVNTRVPETKGHVVMISGCLDSETSAENFINGSWQGAMTSSFLHCVKTSTNAVELVGAMQTYLKTNGYKQRPLLSSGKPLGIGSTFVETARKLAIEDFLKPTV